MSNNNWIKFSEALPPQCRKVLVVYERHADIHIGIGRMGVYENEKTGEYPYIAVTIDARESMVIRVEHPILGRTDAEKLEEGELLLWQILPSVPEELVPEEFKEHLKDMSVA